MQEFWEVLELLEYVARGFQASFGQLCKGNYTGNERVLPELLEYVGTGLQASFGQLCKGNCIGNVRVLEGA